MVRRKPRRKPLGTIWEISDELWRRIEPILLEFWPKKPTGRKVANWRKMLNAIIFRLRSGCQWDQLPERYDPRALSTTGSGAGLQQGSSNESGRSWSPSVTNSAGCSGSGSRPTRCWARPALGGKKDGQESHRPRKNGHQKEHGDRWRRWTAGGGDRRGERAGTEAPGSDDREYRGRAARADKG